MKKIAFTFVLLFVILSANAQWAYKKNFSGSARFGSVAFFARGSLYVGTGQVGTSGSKDFWEYRLGPDVWTQKADYAGGDLLGAVAFDISDYGYVCTGSTDNNASNVTKNLYKYDPYNNTWAKKADFPGSSRMRAVSFTINSVAYIGLGEDQNGYFKDFYAYYPIQDKWDKKTDFAGSARTAAAAFAMNDKGFVGTGAENFSSGGTATKDFYEYDYGQNKWTKRADFIGSARAGAFGFSIGESGFIGGGNDGNILNPKSDFFEYSYWNKTWTNAPASKEKGSFAFGVVSCDEAYVGLANDGSSTTAGTKSLQQYKPNYTLSVSVSSNKDTVCEGDCLYFGESGNVFANYWSWTFSGIKDSFYNGNTPKKCYDSAGVFKVSLNAYTDKCSYYATKNITVLSKPSKPMIKYIGSKPSTDATGKYQWYRDGVKLAGDTNQTLTNDTFGIVMVCVTNMNGCTACSDSLTYNATRDVKYSSFGTFPNPADKLITVEHSSNQVEILSINNMLGQLISSYIWLPGQTIQSLTVSEWPEGIYIIKLGNMSQRILVQH